MKLLDDFDRMMPVRAVILVYWAFFWLLNGLDKFFNYEHFFGVDRDQKFIAYFASLDLPAWLAEPSLYFFGVFELAVGLLFVISLIDVARSPVLDRLTFKATMIIFILYSIGDILFGDRSELREHGIYMILAIVSFQFFILAGERTGRSA
jgi:hypothetical protein